MNLEKAIELLDFMLVEPHPKWSTDNFDAVKLGIEASKEVNALRKVLKGLGNSLLPGETKE